MTMHLIYFVIVLSVNNSKHYNIPLFARALHRAKTSMLQVCAVVVIFVIID